MSDREKITVTTTVPATALQAWKAYTDPDAITQWNRATDEWCCPKAEVDLRKGGKHSARMEAKDGSEGFDFTGTYEEVDEPNALTLVLDDGRKSRTTFNEAGDQTEVTTIFEADDVAPADMQKQGWQAILDNYREYVASH